MTLRLRARAAADLRAIKAYISRDNPRAAQRVLERLRERWRLLEDFPETGAKRDDLGEGVRHVVVGSYLTLYRIGGDGGIVVMRVLHASRNFGPGDD